MLGNAYSLSFKDLARCTMLFSLILQFIVLSSSENQGSSLYYVVVIRKYFMLSTLRNYIFRLFTLFRTPVL